MEREEKGEKENRKRKEKHNGLKKKKVLAHLGVEIGRKRKENLQVLKMIDGSR